MAKSFKFSLQTVLDVREQTTDRAKRELALVVQQTSRLNQQLHVKQEYLDRQKHKIVESRLSVAEMMASEDHVAATAGEVQQLVERIEELRSIETERRQALATAMQDQKVLEKLREKQRSEYQYELNKREQDLLNELALRRKSYNDE